MKSWVLLLVITIFFLTGCVETTSINGRLTLIEDNFLVECSEQVKQNVNDLSDVGYLCAVQISDDTLFRDQYGEKLSVKDFSDGNIVSVILTKPKVIGESKSSREVDAKEVILIKD